MLTISPGDTLLPVATAVEKAIGYRPHPTTCTRWARRGVQGVKLATVMVGGRPRTTEAAVVELIAKQTAHESEAAKAASDSIGA